MNDELEKDYKRLTESEEIKKKLTSIVIHDLSNPLTAISGGIQLMQMEGEEKLTKEQEKNLNIAFMATKELKRMINSLLDIDKIEEGTLKPNYESFAIDHVARELAEEMEVIAQYDGKIISVKTADDLPPVCADKELIRRVATTLVGNALKFTPPQGSIAVEVFYKEEEENFYVQVKDGGASIPEEHLEKVFNKFIQVETKNKVNVNYGLGLTFCKMIVDLHGGKIWVANGPDRGNLFTFTLPRGEI